MHNVVEADVLFRMNKWNGWLIWLAVPNSRLLRVQCGTDVIQCTPSDEVDFDTFIQQYLRMAVKRPARKGLAWLVRNSTIRSIPCPSH